MTHHLIINASTGETEPAAPDFNAFVADLKRPPDPEPQRPLDPTGALATLLAVTEVLDVTDAANAVGLTPDDLVAEAEGWAAAMEVGS